MSLWWWIPKILIAVGLLGMSYAGWKKDQIRRALIVNAWGQMEIAKHGAGGAAYRAAAATTPGKLKPSLDFYAKHKHYEGDER